MKKNKELDAGQTETWTSQSIWCKRIIHDCMKSIPFGYLRSVCGHKTFFLQKSNKPNECEKKSVSHSNCNKIKKIVEQWIVYVIVVLCVCVSYNLIMFSRQKCLLYVRVTVYPKKSNKIVKKKREQKISVAYRHPTVNVQ